MSVKGKEKAVDLDADDDDDADFFLKKRKTRIIPTYSPVRSPSPIIVLDDSDDEDARARTKKAKPKKPVSALPQWTRSTSSGESRKKRSVGRGSTEERKSQSQTNGPIVIDSSPEKEQRSDKSKKNRELTPPPEMSETEKANIEQAIKSAFMRGTGQAAVPEQPATPSNKSELPSTSAVEDMIKPVFRMVAPLERRQDASAKAIEHYEKRRIITIGRTQPLEYAVKALATQLRKPVDEIVLTLNGDRVHSIALTPSFLGLEYDAEFVCYEKADYNRIQAERKAALEQEDEEDQLPETNDQTASQSSEPAPVETDKVKITLIGAAGSVTATVQPHVTAASLCKYYLTKTNQQKSDNVRLSIDGETVEPSTVFGDLGVEQGEQIDVIRI